MSNETIVTVNPDTYKERRSPFVEAIRRLIHHRSAQIGMILLGLLVLIAILRM